RRPWPRVSMLGEVAKVYGIEGSDPERLDGLAKLGRDGFAARTSEKEALFKLGKTESTGEQIAWAFETFCEPMLPRDRPSFVVDCPIEISPLARKRDGEPRLVDRFEAFAGGFEIANAFTELNDPRDQEARFRAQVEAAKRGNEEAMPYDRDFVRALEHGMPPTAGEGIGIDRLVMLFTDSPGILAVIAFAVLHRMKPPSFSYDKFFADTRELVVWSGLTGLGALLLGLWGASFGVLLGAAETPDVRFAFEAGIARTHLRLNRRTAALLVGLGLVPPGLLFAAGVFARTYDETIRSRTLGAAAPTSLSSIRGDAAAIALSAAAVVAALFLAGRWLQARAQLARLQPGQRRKRPATVVMTAISIAGVSVGVWALTVVLSVMSGFEADL